MGFSDYKEKPKAEEKAFSKRHSGGTFRPPVTPEDGGSYTLLGKPGYSSIVMSVFSVIAISWIQRYRQQKRTWKGKAGIGGKKSTLKNLYLLWLT